MRRLISMTALTAALCVLALPAHAAGTTKFTRPAHGPARGPHGVCPFPVQLDERGGLLVTTTYDAARNPIRYELERQADHAAHEPRERTTLLFDTLGQDDDRPERRRHRHRHAGRVPGSRSSQPATRASPGSRAP